MQFRRRFRHAAAEIAGAVEVGFAGLARAVIIGNGGGAIGGTALDLVHPVLPGEAVIQADDGAAHMQQIGQHREQRRLLPAMLRGGGTEGGAHLADQRAAHPQPAGLVPEARHLAAHPPVTGRAADDDAVIFRQLVRPFDAIMILALGEAGRLRHFGRRGFRDVADVAFMPRLSHPLRHRIGHLGDVAIGGIIENEDASHGRGSLPLMR